MNQATSRRQTTTKTTNKPNDAPRPSLVFQYENSTPDDFFLATIKSKGFCYVSSMQDNKSYLG